jgi:hypothetical protein
MINSSSWAIAHPSVKLALTRSRQMPQYFREQR